MSKLFDTLEKIQNNDTYPPAPGAGVPSSPRPRGNRFIIILVALAFCAIGLFLVLQNIDTFKLPKIIADHSSPILDQEDKPVSQSETARNQIASKLNEEQQASKPLQPHSQNIVQQMTALNNQGVKLISKSEYWKGIYYLNKAHILSPQSVEPLINIGVALMELGLTTPANRFFHEALTIDPDNTQLRNNLSLAAETGILDDSLLKLVNGETISP